MLDFTKRIKKQRGIGLLELMLALAIIAVLLIMATRYYQSTSQSQKVNQAASDIQAILAAAANYRAGDPSGAITWDALKPFLPSGMAKDKTKANPWTGSYDAANGTQGGGVLITIGGVPTDACTALISLERQNTIDGIGGTCPGGTYSAEFGTNTSSTK